MGQTDTGQTARRKDGKGEWLMNTQGLTSAQAAARLSQVGENRLAAKKQASVAAMFFSQFKDVMILILAAATLISVLMGQGAEAVTIIAIVLLNAVMGFLQEYRTEQTLEALKEPCEVELYSDSKYVIDALQKGWAKGWRARGWIKSDKKPALNPDLWERLLALCERHTVRLHWVKGHADNPHNNRCDELAVAESRKYK